MQWSKKNSKDSTYYVRPRCNNASNYRSNQLATLRLSQSEALGFVKEVCYRVFGESIGLSASSVRVGGKFHL